MAKISTYPIKADPASSDMLVGTDVSDLNKTKNFRLSDLAEFFIVGYYVPYVGATGNLDLGVYGLTTSSVTIAGATSSDFLKGDGTLDSTAYQPAGDYITQLSGEVSAMGPGNANAIINNDSVISKVLNGFNATGGTVMPTDSIVTAFGKLQNQVNGLIGGVEYQGVWNANTNTPTLLSGVGEKGHYYVVDVPGSTNLDGITDWKLGDWAIYNGTAWQKVDNTDAVISVNGYTGIVNLTASDVGAATASGTVNYISKFGSPTSLVNSNITDDGTIVQINGTGFRALELIGAGIGLDNDKRIFFKNAAGTYRTIVWVANTNVVSFRAIGAGANITNDSGSITAQFNEDRTTDFFNTIRGLNYNFTSTGGVTNSTLVTGTIGGNIHRMAAGSGVTSSRNVYLDLEATETSPQRWYIGMIGTKDLSFFNQTTGGNYPLAIRSGTNNVLINQPVDNGLDKLQVNGSVSIQGTSLTDGGQLGAELLSASGWTSTDWTGSFGAGYAHTTGNTTALSNSIAAVSGTYYQIAYTVTVRTAGTFTITFGGVTSPTISATGGFGPRATSTGNLIITPTTDFDGTILLSLKVVTTGAASLSLRNSSGSVTNEIRGGITSANIGYGIGALSRTTTGVGNTGVGNNSLNNVTSGNSNTAFGFGSLFFNTTGLNNTAIGNNSMGNNISGFGNTAVGLSSLFTNTTGTNNTANGFNSLLSNTTGGNNTANGANSMSANTTGLSNVAVGVSSLLSSTTGSDNTAVGATSTFLNTTGIRNTAIGSISLGGLTTGSSNVAAGFEAGRYINAGTANQTSNNSVYLGADTRASANGNTNEIVIGFQGRGNGSNTTTIGNSSTVGTYLLGRTLLGAVDNGVDRLQVSGSGLFTGNLTASISALGTAGTTFLTHTSGLIQSRTAVQVLSDIGAAASLSGALNAVPFFNTTSTLASTTLRTDGNNRFSLGGTILANTNFRIAKELNEGPLAVGISSDGLIQTAANTRAFYFYTAARTEAAAFTTNINHFSADQGVFGAGSTVTEQNAFDAGSGLVGATNNYAFRGRIPSGANRWNAFMGGTANNHFNGRTLFGTTVDNGVDRVQVNGSALISDNTTINGNVAIGAVINTARSLNIGRPITGVTNYGVFQSGEVQSGASFSFGYANVLTTQAASFVIPEYTHYTATQGTIGAGSSITDHTGFLAASSLNSGGTIFGFRGRIASGTNRWNTYFDGTAWNYMNGGLAIGSPSVSDLNLHKLYVLGTTKLAGNVIVGNSDGIGILRPDNFNAGVGGAIRINAGATSAEQYIAFGQSASGGAGTFTERSRMSASGFWLINNAVSNGVDRFNVNGSIISTQYKLSALNTAPSSASDTGTLGEIRIDADFIYICTATNTWKRSVLLTW